MNERFLFRGKRKDEQIIEALKCCIAQENCEEVSCEICPYNKVYDCKEVMLKNALDIFNRQAAENERLTAKILVKDNINDYNTAQLRIAREELRTAKSNAIKEFTERVETLVLPLLLAATLEERDMVYRCLSIIDDLVKEMTEG